MAASVCPAGMPSMPARMISLAVSLGLVYVNTDLATISAFLPYVAIGAIETAVRTAGGALLVTADHGNLEMMRDPETGQPHTAHTVGPVPFVYVGDREGVRLRSGGALRDVAPTMLDLLGLPQPAEMSGRSLLDAGMDV